MKFICQCLIWYGIGDGSFVSEPMEILVGLPFVANGLTLVNLLRSKFMMEDMPISTLETQVFRMSSPFTVFQVFKSAVNDPMTCGGL